MSNMVVNTNVLALNAHKNLAAVGNTQAKASQRLSSGMKINSAADDAAGLAISEKMRAQVRGLDMASKNAQDGISLIQTAEGSMQEVTNMVQRVRELTVQAANDTNTTEDRKKIGNEVNQLTQEITDMASRTEFNTKKLATGSFSGSGNELTIQVGANANQSIKFNIDAVTSTSLGLNGLASAISASGATASSISSLISTVENAVKTVTDQRADLGAVQNRVEYTINNLKTSSENLSAAESRIRDTDMAKEMMNMTKANVLQQAATSMLAQANQAPQGVLKLLG